MRDGFTIFELAMVVVVAAIIGGLAVPRVGSALDQIATDRAVSGVMVFYHRARLVGTWRATPVELEFRHDSLTATLRGATDSVVLSVAGPAYHGVSMSASRSKISIYPSGLGWGAANTKLIFRRGAAAESLTTSRLGRLKRW